MVYSNKLDTIFMQKALDQAKKAYELKEIPIGAVVVFNKNANDEAAKNIIVGTGYNQSESKNSQLYHAEMIAIDKATRYFNNWRLLNCTIYITVQPCLMCFGLIGLSRIERLVYGAKSPLFGCPLDNGDIPLLYKTHVKNITSGIMAESTSDILKDFFKRRRESEGHKRYT